MHGERRVLEAVGLVLEAILRGREPRLDPVLLAHDLGELGRIAEDLVALVRVPQTRERRRPEARWGIQSTATVQRRDARGSRTAASIWPWNQGENQSCLVIMSRSAPARLSYRRCTDAQS